QQGRAGVAGRAGTLERRVDEAFHPPIWRCTDRWTSFALSTLRSSTLGSTLTALVVQANQHLIQHRRRAPRARVVEDGDHGPGVAIAVSAVAGDGSHIVQSPGFYVRLAGNTSVVQALAHGAVQRGYGHR